MLALRPTLAAFATLLPLFAATAYADEAPATSTPQSSVPPASVPAGSSANAAVGPPTAPSAPRPAYAPQVLDAEAPRYQPLPQTRLPYMAPGLEGPNRAGHSLLWKAGAGLTGSGLAVASVGGGLVAYGLVVGLNDNPQVSSTSKSYFVPGCVLAVGGGLALLVGIPMWIAGAVQGQSQSQ